MLNRISSLAAGVTLSLGSLAVATSASAQEPTPTEPCAKQASQVEKAELALERLTAVFERQKVKVDKAKVKVDKADNASEVAKAKRLLREAKSDRSDAKDTKKAQVQRLAKASERLAACEAELTES